MMRQNDESLEKLHQIAAANLESAERTGVHEFQSAYAARSVAASNLIIIELMLRNGVCSVS